MSELASSNRAQARYKLEGEYPTNFGVTMTAGNGTNVNMTSETLTFDQKYEMSKVLRSDRSPAGHTLVSVSSAGALNVEHQYREFDPFYESVMGNVFTAYGTDGVSAEIDLTLASGTITAGSATSGADAFTTLHKGQWVSLIPPAGATTAVKEYFRRRAFRLHLTTAPTSTVITLDATTPINTTIAGTDGSDFKIATSRLYTGTRMWSYNLEVAHEDVDVFRLYRGQIPGKINWKLTIGQIVAGSIEFMGKDMDALGDATFMGTPVAVQPFGQANATRGVFDIIEGTASISATTYIKSGEFTIDGSLRMQDAIGVLGAAGIAPGTFRVGGTLEVYFANKVMYQKFLDGNKSSLCIPILDNDGNGYVYYFPYVTYTAAKVNATGQDQDAVLSMSFECDYDAVSSGADTTANKVCAIYRVGAIRAV
jgi:hypothetical protein